MARSTFTIILASLKHAFRRCHSVRNSESFSNKHSGVAIRHNFVSYTVIFSLTETEIETEIIDLQLTETEIETEIIFKTETELKLKSILILKLKYTSYYFWQIIVIYM